MGETIYHLPPELILTRVFPLLWLDEVAPLQFQCTWLWWLVHLHFDSSQDKWHLARVQRARMMKRAHVFLLHYNEMRRERNFGSEWTIQLCDFGNFQSGYMLRKKHSIDLSFTFDIYANAFIVHACYKRQYTVLIDRVRAKFCCYFTIDPCDLIYIITESLKYTRKQLLNIIDEYKDGYEWCCSIS
jgi:hypothetical protein